MSATPIANIILLGTGVVGSQVLAQLAAAHDSGAYRLLGVANTRACRVDLDGVSDYSVPSDTTSMMCVDTVAAAAQARDAECVPIIIDATASTTVAQQHHWWLAQGWHVVTANKAAAGGSLADWRALDVANPDPQRGRYGYSATVGAGLPMISSITRIARRERIHAISGVLSGSISWLLNNHRRGGDFAELVKEAVQRGICEPDPMLDLSGVDVHRKLLILARTAGYEIDTDDVDRTPLLNSLADTATFDDVLTQHLSAATPGSDVVYAAELICDGDHVTARVGLQAVPADHPLAHLGGDNLVAIASERYRENPLRIGGPGAGAAITAGALLDDVDTIVTTTARPVLVGAAT